MTFNMLYLSFSSCLQSSPLSSQLYSHKVSFSATKKPPRSIIMMNVTKKEREETREISVAKNKTKGARKKAQDDKDKNFEEIEIIKKEERDEVQRTIKAAGLALDGKNGYRGKISKEELCEVLAKLVDVATKLEEPNSEINNLICDHIDKNKFNRKEIVRAIKRKMRSVSSQRLSLEILEAACAMKCGDQVFSEIVSEKVLDEMVWLVKNGESEKNRKLAFQLIRAWGKSQDLPVFHQAYMGLEVDYNFGNLSINDMEEQIKSTDKMVESLSVNLQDDCLMEKCKQSKPLIKMIIDATTDHPEVFYKAMQLDIDLDCVLSSYKKNEDEKNETEKNEDDETEK